MILDLFDKPEFFDKIAERSQLSGQSPDLLFFAFYYQPVSLPSPEYCGRLPLVLPLVVLYSSCKRRYAL